MATVRQMLVPEIAAFPSSTFAKFVRNLGTNFAVTGVAFNDTTAQSAFWRFVALAYGSGNITCEVIWYADTSTTSAHGVTWQVSLAAITAGTDTTNVETKAFATAQTGTTDLGSTDAQKLISTSVAISNLDSVAAGDECWLKVTRLVSDGSDDLTGDAIISSIRLSYSDS